MPVNKVVEIFDNTDNLPHWQKGLESYNLVSGTKGIPGAKASIVIKQGRMVIELTETLLVNNLPAVSSALYEHKHMVNTMTNRFIATSENSTRYETEINYTKFIGFVPSMMALLMPGVFKKQVQTTIDRFKAFAEKSQQPTM